MIRTTHSSAAECRAKQYIIKQTNNCGSRVLPISWPRNAIGECYIGEPQPHWARACADNRYTGKKKFFFSLIPTWSFQWNGDRCHMYTTLLSPVASRGSCEGQRVSKTRVRSGFVSATHAPFRAHDQTVRLRTVRGGHQCTKRDRPLPRPCGHVHGYHRKPSASSRRYTQRATVSHCSVQGCLLLGVGAEPRLPESFPTKRKARMWPSNIGVNSTLLTAT